MFFFTEIEAKEACKWLRAAGFPQYSQMYEGKYYYYYNITITVWIRFSKFFHDVFLFFSLDLQFPIDVNGVQKDHPFLDLDSLQSLFRRLHALNRCANMKLDFVPKHAVSVLPIHYCFSFIDRFDVYYHCVRVLID